MASKEHKKYSVSYCSGATGFGWTAEYDRLDEFENFINEMRNEYTASINVYDCTLEKFIFWKKALCIKPSIDLLNDFFRDMRTATRKMR